MPELPEVETVRRGISAHAMGRVIQRVVVRNGSLRWPVPADIDARVRGRAIGAITRRGKYLLLDTGPGTILIHLGMSGRLHVLTSAAALRVHDHVDIDLEGGITLRLHDPRRFGAVLYWDHTDPEPKLLAHLGPEPLSEAFNGDYLYQRSRGKRTSIKAFIMDADVVVGAGNIYAQEALFAAGIRPRRAAGRLSRGDCMRLVECIRRVLEAAITAGGTTLRDFTGADGAPGYFQQDLYVYGREGLPCRVCGSGILNVRIGGRASHYCPVCQPR
jgi:formamidopyrimidine-DNA glycosylase